MLTTFVIGLREGLEAALIVGIIAAFLGRNGASLRPMWLGVALAIALSVAVGLGLDLFEHTLPQAAQEGMESVIALVAVVFVTGMIFWMGRHARGLKREIEAEAADALGRASTLALASMAFLAVLKEGFETSVFLLATFSAAQSPLLAAGGAVLGLLLAAAIGWGIYLGGIKLNLSRFFRITGAFLILVAAGLVVSSLHSAHGAGWLLAGQQPTLNLGWLVAPGTVQSALATGVLGIPANPRLIELVGWLAYLLPVAILVYWPHAWRPSPRVSSRLRLGLAGAMVLVAITLATAWPRGAQLPPSAPVVSTASGASIGAIALADAAQDGSAQLTLTLNGRTPIQISLPGEARRTEQRDGFDVSVWSVPLGAAPNDHPTTVTLDQLIALAGRVPVGFNARQRPGPFDAAWSATGTLKVAIASGVLLEAAARTTTVITLTGGGLTTPRSLSISGDAADSWQLAGAYHDQAVAALADSGAAIEHQFWAIELPIALLVLAVLLAAYGRMPLRSRTPAEINSAAPQPVKLAAKGSPHAVR